MKKLFIFLLPIIALFIACKNTPEHKLSLKEIQNLLQGTWAPADDDTVPYLYETYDAHKIHYIVKYVKDSAYLKAFNSSPDYYLSFECPPDSLNVLGDEQEAVHRGTHLKCICYLMRVESRKKLFIESLKKITKDTLIEDDGQRDYILIKVH